jgi:hypothetical protein
VQCSAVQYSTVQYNAVQCSPHLDCHFSELHEVQGLPHLTEAPSAQHAQQDVPVVQAGKIPVKPGPVFTLTSFQFLFIGRQRDGRGKGKERRNGTGDEKLRDIKMLDRKKIAAVCCMYRSKIFQMLLLAYCLIGYA